MQYREQVEGLSPKAADSAANLKGDRVSTRRRRKEADEEMARISIQDTNVFGTNAQTQKSPAIADEKARDENLK